MGIILSFRYWIGKESKAGKVAKMDTKRYLFVINDAPYGNERPYNALRHAMNLVKREGAEKLPLEEPVVMPEVSGQVI